MDRYICQLRNEEITFFRIDHVGPPTDADGVGLFEIFLFECDDIFKIARWIEHLEFKNWFTPLLTQQFIKYACGANGLKVRDVNKYIKMTKESAPAL